MPFPHFSEFSELFAVLFFRSLVRIFVHKNGLLSIKMTMKMTTKKSPSQVSHPATQEGEFSSQFGI